MTTKINVGSYQVCSQVKQLWSCINATTNQKNFYLPFAKGFKIIIGCLPFKIQSSFLVNW